MGPILTAPEPTRGIDTFRFIATVPNADQFASLQSQPLHPQIFQIIYETSGQLCICEHFGFVHRKPSYTKFVTCPFLAFSIPCIFRSHFSSHFPLLMLSSSSFLHTLLIMQICKCFLVFSKPYCKRYITFSITFISLSLKN